ncbi:MAG: carbohydrate-binding family 9-like protein [candidate division Zixibacteria bacterium]|nr:carbohydrate-binding family 9-like protein [candidate division Zixibacteria bacterium]
MRILFKSLILIACLLNTGCNNHESGATNKTSGTSVDSFPVPIIEFTPKQYVCYKTDETIKIDGRLNEVSWSKTNWTGPFVDIEGDSKPMPRFMTRAKMLWDDDYFYFAAYLEEPDIWAKLTGRDAVIFYDNDFEVFIDPDGDTHEYYELEVNAFSTEWDLFLVKPYRDGGPAIHSWDIQGLKTAVHIDGTINSPGDIDKGWSVEIAMPWTVLRECAHKNAPPSDGDQWRVNFSRVEWQTEILNGDYAKITDPNTGESLPEDNWVWSPQGLINMHYPEMWGYVQFSDKAVGGRDTQFKLRSEEQAKWAMRMLYYAQRNYHNEHGKSARSYCELNIDIDSVDGYNWPPEIMVTSSLFEANLKGLNNQADLYISQDGHTWTSDK